MAAGVRGYVALIAVMRFLPSSPPPLKFHLFRDTEHTAPTSVEGASAQVRLLPLLDRNRV